ncbi:acetolactate synthase small subunit [Clostridium felsineum]|uniref:Acetolactate synthase small subunit n=1 Tax=Clostridium felsineum TaxID=36839 RepID=A0A1S8KXQ1_9CLOT|nr:acetolactate synthase small subunit [Clostridium felsineum]MCR3758069.1 acetolactate synthase small subunit [Clostridium felsineum]URZ03417.1 Acetolactate synthase small subunit [Clostridium felsineum]URZ08266.1 Acetolactate synthase small subunit [Clostridium felsineum]URZ13297.1 Acetolactate synthase small subunit [Clostridium felsineum]URZ14722.1 Acetolactate synthase small subunit [Clostridium felsineum DSM 794]
MRLYVLAVLVDNIPGVLNRVCGLFNRRGYNLESVTAGVTENEKISRLTLIASVNNESEIEQIVKQIKKIEVVHKVVLLNKDESVCREIMLIKVNAEGVQRQEILNTVTIFRASVVDVTTKTFTIEITGNKSKIEAFQKMLEPYGIIEVVSSGSIAIQRGQNSITS